MYKLFIPQHTTTKHRVFAITSSEVSFDHLEAVATFDERWEAVRVADALNNYIMLRDEEIILSSIEHFPAPVQGSIKSVVEKISLQDYFQDISDLHRAYDRMPIFGFMRFPVEGVGDPDEDWFEEPTFTPAKAAIMHAVATNLADEAEDSKYPFAGIDAAFSTQSKSFHAAMSEKFSEIAKSLFAGNEPERDGKIATEIAMEMILVHAEELFESDVANLIVSDLPKTQFDGEFDSVQYEYAPNHDLCMLTGDGDSVIAVDLLDLWFEGSKEAFIKWTNLLGNPGELWVEQSE